ncbi:MAG: DNA-binding protein [Desulfovibrio sp.]|nr:DNA-binding protein [Desulfovibrio sp.]
MEPLTEKQIVQAITQIMKNGQQPSIARIRRFLGRGSNSTIGGVLKKWHAVRPNQDGDVNIFEQPLPPPKPKQKTTKELFESLAEGIAEIKAEFERQRNEKADMYDMLEKAISTMTETALRGVTAPVQDVKSDADLANRIRELENARQAAEARAARAEADLAEMKAKIKKIQGSEPKC